VLWILITYHPDVDPDSGFLVYADPDPTFHPDPDPLKSANIGLISAN
jgi:hypothetical protein